MFQQPLRALVIGGKNGGVGKGLVSVLHRRHPNSTIFITGRADSQEPNYVQLDLTNDSSVATLPETLKAMSFTPNLILNATGVLTLESGERPETSVKKFNEKQWLATLKLNTIGPALLIRELPKIIAKDEEAIFATWSARVGSLHHNELGGWCSYRASKCALNMLVKTAAIEFKRSHPLLKLISVHPGTVDTSMSKSFVNSKKRATLVSHYDAAFEFPPVEEKQFFFTPEVSAETILDKVLMKLEAEDSGGFVDYAKRRIEW